MSRFSSRRRQRGDMLLEAMVGVLITALIGAGMAHVLSSISRAQHDTAVDALAVNQLRNVLQIQGVGVCEDSTLATGKQGLPAAIKSQVQISVSCQAASPGVVTIGGVGFPGTVPSVVTLGARAQGGEELQVRTVVAPRQGDTP